MKEVRYSKDARKALRRMASTDSARIVRKINQYAADPASLANSVRALKGRNALRRRIGDWRVIFRDGQVIGIIRIAPRGKAYE